MAFDPSEYRGNVLLVAAVVCTVLSTLSFAGRLWGRSLSAVRLGWDDLLMAIAMVGCWSIAAINILGLRYGFGRHTAFLEPLDIRNYIITLFTFFLLQTITTALIKIAILIFYQRTFTTKGFQKAVYIVGAIVVANSIGVFVAVCCFCTPIAHFWDPRGVPGHCVNEVVATTLFSLTLMITDLIIYVLPMPIIWKLNMTLRRKMELSLVFVIGLFVCLTRIVQLVDTIRLDFADPTWSNIDVAIWNIVESHIGLVAANIPLMGPLISLLDRKLRPLASFASSRYGRGAHSHDKYGRDPLSVPSHGFNRIVDDGSEDTSRVVVTSPVEREDEIKLDEEIYGLHQLERGRPAILVKTDVEQNFDGSILGNRGLYRQGFE